MQTQLKVDFHGAAPGKALQDKIVEHVDSLERMFGRLTACHVSLEPPGHHQRKGGLGANLEQGPGQRALVRVVKGVNAAQRKGQRPRHDHRIGDLP